MSQTGHHSNAFTMRLGKQPRDCRYCGKWLRREERDAYGNYCRRCAENLGIPRRHRLHRRG